MSIHEPSNTTASAAGQRLEGPIYGSRQGAILGIIRSPRFLAVTFAVFIAIRLALILLVPVEPYSDYLWYFTRGAELAEFGRYWENGVPTAYWPVGYPAILGALFRITGPSVLSAQLLNLAFACASFWLVYSLSKAMLRDETAARLAVLLLAVYPNNIAYTALLATESVYTLLTLLIVFGFVIGRGSRYVLGIGIAIGVATLVKSQTPLFAAALSLCAVALARDWQSRRRVMTRVTLMAVVAIAVVLPWTARNYATFGTPIFVSTNGGMTLLIGNNPSMVGLWSRDYAGDDPLVLEARFAVAEQVEADRRAKRLALNWIQQNPGSFVSLIPQKVWRLWAIDGEAEWSFDETTPWYSEYKRWFRAIRYTNQAFYVGVLAAGGFAVLLLVRARADSWAYLGLTVPVYISILCFVFPGQSRFHFPAMPFILIYAGYFLADRLARNARKGPRVTTLGSAG